MEAALLTLIEEVCSSTKGAYERLSYCLANNKALDDKPPVSAAWFRQIIEELTFRAHAGNAPAKSLLGDIYLKGWAGVEPDLAKALHYARQAASLGESGGEVLLGMFYAQGLEGVMKNYQRAMEWFKRALDKGNNRAMNNIGVMYEEGWGVKKDVNLALKYYRQAAEEDNPLAKKNIERLLTTLPAKS